MNTYKLQFRSKFQLLFWVSVCIYGLLALIDLVGIIRIWFFEIEYFKIMLTLRFFAEIFLIGCLLLLLYRRSAMLLSRDCVLELGLKSKYIPYSEITEVHWASPVEAKFHRQWDYGEKESKIVLVCRSGKKIYVSVERPAEFYEAIRQKIMPLKSNESSKPDKEDGCPTLAK